MCSGEARALGPGESVEKLLASLPGPCSRRLRHSVGLYHIAVITVGTYHHSYAASSTLTRSLAEPAPSR